MTKHAQSESRKCRDISDLKHEKMEKALHMYRQEQEKEEDKQKSIRQIASECGVPKSTLSDRIKGKQSIREFNSLKQKLTVAEEEVLAQLISISSDRGVPFDHRTISQYANRLIEARLEDGEEYEPVGGHWVFNFLERHQKTLKTYWSKGLDTKRAQGVNPNAIDDWFDILQRELTEKGILQENTYAMDEVGFERAGEGTRRVAGTVGKKIQYKQGNGNREIITALITICADGSNISPLVIYKARRLR